MSSLDVKSTTPLQGSPAQGLPQGSLQSSTSAFSLAIVWCRENVSVTALGLLTGGMSAFVYLYFSQEERDLILEMMCLLLLGVTLLLSVLIYLERWRLKRLLAAQSSAALIEVEVRRELLTGFSIPSMNLNPLFQLKVSLAHPLTSDYQLELYEGRLCELVSLHRRGHIKSAIRVFKLEDVFGLTELTWRMLHPCELKVLPQTSDLSMKTIEQLQEGEDLYDPYSQSQGDLIELRRYADGDPLKWILWRVYARSRELVVRSPERALSPKTDLSVYFLADPTDEASASTVRSYLELGMFGEEYQLFADGCAAPAQHRQEALERLIESADGRPLSALPLLLERDARQLRGVIVFASALTPTERLLEVVNALPTPPLVILSVYLDLDTSSKPRGVRSRFTRADHESSLNAGATSGDMERVQANLDALSIHRPPVVIAQPRGEVLSADALSRLRDHLSAR